MGGVSGAVRGLGNGLLLSGDLGAGKTTLARAMLKARGRAGEAPSPTFAIVQPYAPPEVDLAIAHVDLSRIEDADELIELGLDEYLYDGPLLIEWPDRLGGTAWPLALALTISCGGAARAFTESVPPASEARLPRRVFRPPTPP